MKEFEYPFDSAYFLKKQKSIKRKLLEEIAVTKSTNAKILEIKN